MDIIIYICNTSNCIINISERQTSWYIDTCILTRSSFIHKNSDICILGFRYLPSIWRNVLLLRAILVILKCSMHCMVKYVRLSCNVFLQKNWVDVRKLSCKTTTYSDANQNCVRRWGINLSYGTFWKSSLKDTVRDPRNYFGFTPCLCRFYLCWILQFRVISRYNM